MKNWKFIFIMLLSITLFTVNDSHAAFPVKRDISLSSSSRQDEAIVAKPTVNKIVTVTDQSNTAVKKHSFFSRLLAKIARMEEDAAIPQAAYIILSILPFGWLAIGLNDNFEGISWLIALLLYILGWLPGIIYSLIVMGNYY